MFYNSPLTGGVPWLVLDVQVFMARNGEERKNVREGLGERKGYLSSSPYPPSRRFFSLCASLRFERLEQAS